MASLAASSKNRFLTHTIEKKETKLGEIIFEVVKKKEMQLLLIEHVDVKKKAINDAKNTGKLLLGKTD